MSAEASLNVVFDLPLKLSRGEFVCGVVRVENIGNTACVVSARLNLFEGDLRVRLTGPDGRPKRIHGAYQVDSAPRRLSLGPDESIESGLNLFFTSSGLTFAEAGEYRLQLEYDPSVRQTIVSDERRLLVHEPDSERDRELAALTLNVDLGRALALADSSSSAEAPARLQRLAESFSERTEGRVAALVLGIAQNKDGARHLTDAFSTADAVELAHWVSGLATPASPRGRALSTALIDFLDSAKADDRERTRARAIASVKPYRARTKP